MTASRNLILIFSLLAAASVAVNVEEPEYAGESCNRECVAGDQRICYFKFTLEFYQSMGVACGECARGVWADCEHPQCIIGDGVDKGVMSINRKIPGPPVHVCQNDLIVVDVVNLAGGSAAAIHWHGLHMRRTPWMDGVPFVTQCPIAGGNTFRYYMNASEPGTHFYHSHSGHHKINGQYGALIVRQPIEQDRTADAYDEDNAEHHILISDWMHSYGEMYFPGLSSSKGILPNSMLINGRGAYIDPNTGDRRSVPPTVYNVKPNTRYRFRVINSVSHICPTQLQIEDHSFSVIATDSFDVSPQVYDTLVTNSGERFDFILETNQEPRDYWIRVRGLGMCSDKPMEAFALLRYGGDGEVLQELPYIPNYDEPYPMGKSLNSPNATCGNVDSDENCVTELQALDEDPALLQDPVDYKFYLAYNNYPVDPAEIFKPGTYNHFANLRGKIIVVGAINNISLIFPPSPPLTQPEDIDQTLICHDLNRPARCDNQQLCPCVHILHVATGSIVELIVVDESRDVGPINHPFHLHGHRFAVTAMGQDEEGRPMTTELARQIDAHRGLRHGLPSGRAIFKDTISIPSRGYSTIRFRADNPGYWLMHCHYEWHLAIGMGLILQVGDAGEMVPPPANFPTCGNYQRQDFFG